MRPALIRATVFSVGVFAFWLVHFLRQLGVDLAHGGTAYGFGIGRALGFATSLTVSSGVGAFLGLAAARGATTSIPLWLAASGGVAFGVLTQPALDMLGTIGFPVRETLAGSLLGAAFAAVVFGWLLAQIVQMVGRRVPVMSREYRRIQADQLETASLLLAASPWVLGMAQFLGVPGFG